MIRSFRNKALAKFAATGNARGLSVQKPDRIARLLKARHAATQPAGINLPGFRFHALKGKDKGRYAIWASENWRMTFGWEGIDAVEVDLEDYH
jgi:proteic killer suppression protein